jgi:hypothetical protein
MKRECLKAVLATAVLAAGVLIASAGDAQAAPFTFSCPPGAECAGSTYGLKLTDAKDLGGGVFEYEVTYGIKTTGAYTGSSTDFIHAVSFKSVVSDFTDLTLKSAPGGIGGWDVSEKGRSASGPGCKDGGEHAACAEAKGFGVSVAPGEYFWTFSFKSTDATPGPTGHIKFLYVTDTLTHKDEYRKRGTLGSFDVPLQPRDPPPPPPPHDVPEPATMALFGMALAASAGRYLRARRQ